MSEDLIARLKAAHEAATPGPLRVKQEIGGYEWVFDARDEVVMEGESGDLALYVLTRNALPEIIAALEERERMRAVVDRLQKLVKELSDWTCENESFIGDSDLPADKRPALADDACWQPCGECLPCLARAALDALEKSHDRLPG